MKKLVILLAVTNVIALVGITNLQQQLKDKEVKTEEVTKVVTEVVEKDNHKIDNQYVTVEYKEIGDGYYELEVTDKKDGSNLGLDDQIETYKDMSIKNYIE